MASAARLPRIPVALSTSSVYPDGCATAFQLAERLGYDGVELMVWTDALSQDVDAIRALSDLHGIPVLSVHAPTLLMTQQVWGTRPWDKVDRSVRLAAELGASTVVVHPPFRWQGPYAREFVAGLAPRTEDAAEVGVVLTVENMYPWRVRGRELLAYLPHWDPVSLDYPAVTLDLSHTATSRSDALAMARSLGGRLRHIHLADGLGSPRDEHLVPGRGSQPCAEVLELLVASQLGDSQLGGVPFGGSVVVEVSVRAGGPDQREADLAEALAFARRHLASPACSR